jgi:hypothetical protein
MAARAQAQPNSTVGTATTLQQEWAEKLAMAEAVIAREEAASGRAFDRRFRTRAKMTLASLPTAALESRTQPGGLETSRLGDSQTDLVYTPVIPCRIIDTRLAGGVLPAGTTRHFRVAGADYSDQGGSATGCGVPYGPTTAAVVNFVAVTPAGQGNLQVTSFGAPMRLASIVNYSPGVTIANGLVVAICDPSVLVCSSDITIKANVSATGLVADVQGYFRVVDFGGGTNTFVGLNAGPASTGDLGNSAVGYSALRRITTGFSNSALGSWALFSNTEGYANGAFGVDALYQNTTGYFNSAFGQSALWNNTTGMRNSGFGAWALVGNSTGWGNSAFGDVALGNLQDGDLNIAIGQGAGLDLAIGSHNVYIGHGGAATESNTIRIGAGGTQTATYVAGIWGSTSASGVPVLVNVSGQLGTSSSSRRFKDEIRGMDEESDILMKLRPVAFYYKPEYDDTRTRQYGLVAEEVAELAPQLVVYDEGGEPQAVRYHFINAMLLNEVQKQRRRLEEQQETIQDLEARLATLEAAPDRDR